MADDDFFGGFGDEEAGAADTTVADAPALREVAAGELQLRERARNAHEEAYGVHVAAGTLDSAAVTVKILSSEDAARKEATLLASLVHDNVITITGLAIGGPWGVLLADTIGESLHSLLHTTPLVPMDFELQSKLGQDLFRGLLFLHNKDIVLARLTAASLLVSADRTTARIADFTGAFNKRSTDAAALVAAPPARADPAYAPPEGPAPTQDANVFAAGLLFWEILMRRELNVEARPAEWIAAAAEAASRSAESAGTGAGAGAAAEGGEGGGGEGGEGEGAPVPPPLPEWMPELSPEFRASSNITTLLAGCLRVRAAARFSALAATAVAERVHTQARQVRIAALNEARWVAELPLELALQIFVWLDPVAACNVRATCQAWRLLVDAWSDEIWTGVANNTFGGAMPPTSTPFEFAKQTYSGYRKQLRTAQKDPAGLNNWAIFSGHHRVVKTQLRAKALDAAGSARNQTPFIFVAVQQGHAEVVRLLLSHGARTDQVAEKMTLIEAAVKKGDMTIVNLVAEALQNSPTGADLSALPLDAMLAMAAGVGGAVKTVEWLLRVGANPNPTVIKGNTPLANACKIGAIDTVEALLAAGASVMPQAGGSPLSFAVDNNRPAIVQLLLDRGAKPGYGTGKSGRDMSVALALMRADRLPILHMLLEADPVHAPRNLGKNEQPVAHVAAEVRNLEGLKMLVARDPGVLTQPGPHRWDCLPLMTFCYGGYATWLQQGDGIAMLDYFIEVMGEEAVLAARARHGYTTVLMALVGHPWNALLEHALTRTCLRKQLNAGDQAGQGSTPLHAGHQKSIPKLVAMGARVSLDQDGRSPLHYVYDCTFEAVQALLSAGASFDQRDSEGNPPLATVDKNSDVAIFLAAGADPRIMGSDNRSFPMYMVACLFRIGDVSPIWRTMRDVKFDMNHLDTNGRNVLHYLPGGSFAYPGYGARNGLLYFSVVMYFVRLGADPKQRDNDGHSPCEAMMDHLPGHVDKQELARGFWTRIEAGEDLVDEEYAPVLDMEQLCSPLDPSKPLGF